MEDIMQTVEALNEVSCMPGEHMIVCDNDVLIRRTAERALNVIRAQQAEIERLKEQQPKKGHWEVRKRQRTYTGTPYIKYRCSVCGEWVDQYENSAFCPFCGADMRGEQE